MLCITGDKSETIVQDIHEDQDVNMHYAMSNKS